MKRSKAVEKEKNFFLENGEDEAPLKKFSESEDVDQYGEDLDSDEIDAAEEGFWRGHDSAYDSE
jgi:hypothetical protein